MYTNIIYTMYTNIPDRTTLLNQKLRVLNKWSLNEKITKQIIHTVSEVILNLILMPIQKTKRNIPKINHLKKCLDSKYQIKKK